MSPSPYFPELSTPDSEEEQRECREEELIDALFTAAEEAKPRAHCLDLIGMLLGNPSAEEYLECVKKMRPGEAQDKSQVLETMLINQMNGHPVIAARVKELMMRKSA